MERRFGVQVLVPAIMDPASAPRSAGGGGRWSWSVLGAMSLLAFVITASTFSSLGVVLPAMVKDLGWSWSGAGLGFTLLGACCGASSWFPTLLIRRWGVRATLAAGAGVMVVGFLLLAIAHGLPAYFAGTALLGVGYQMSALIPGTHLLSKAFPKRGRAFGIYFTAGSLGGVAGPWMVLGVMSTAHQDWRVFWLVMAGLAVATAIVCLAVIGAPHRLASAAERTAAVLAAEAAAPPAPGRVYRTRRDWTAREAVRTPQFYVLLAAYFGHLLCGVTVASLSVAHLTEQGVLAATAGGMLSLESLMQTLGRAGGGMLGDRLDPKRMLVFASAAMVAGLAALAVARGPLLLLVYAAGTGLGFGLTALAVTMLLLNYFGDRHNLEIFSLTCLVGAFSALGPVIGGVIRDSTGSFVPTFLIYAVVLIPVLGASLFIRPPGTRRERDVEPLPGLTPRPADS